MPSTGLFRYMPPHSRPAASSFRNQARTTVKRCSAALCAALLLALGACGEPDADLPSDAYVWQRIWTAPVTQAMSDNADVVRAWRVLMAEMNADGRWFTASPDLAALAAAKRPVVMVVRLDGRAGALPAVDVLARISAARSAWSSAGISLAGVEIDYDCPTSKLPLYAAFLAALKKEAGPDLPLSITALPTWLNSPALDALLRIPDEAVLQVHAVLSPEQGLFQARRARAWLAAFAERTQRPWRVALPTYGSRVVWSDDGSIAAIESERPALLPGGRSSELVATPAAIAAFVDEIQRSPPRGLAGIAWFRLPTASDERAWSLATWRAVLTRQPLLPALSVTARSAGGNNAQDLILANSGSADAALPFAIRWDGACRAADGINGYSLEHDAGGAFLRRSQDGLLRAGSQRNIGWIRCENGPASFHVQP